MTDHEMRMAIAELCLPGYSGALPDYPKDLKSMHLAEEWLEANHPGKCLNYACEIRYVISKGGSVVTFRHVHASARHRAEAFLRTLGKWKD